MILNQTYEKQLMNLKVPKPLKKKFQQKCNENFTNMSSVIINYMKTYITE